MFNFLGGPFATVLAGTAFNGTYQWLKPIVTFIDGLIVPFTIVALAVGAIWVVILGIKLARADSADQAQEAKKALIRVAIAFVATIAAVWIIGFLASQIPTIFATNPVA